MFKCVLQYIDKMRMLVPEFWERIPGNMQAVHCLISVDGKLAETNSVFQFSSTHKAADV